MDAMPTLRYRALPDDTQRPIGDTFGVSIPAAVLRHIQQQRTRLQGLDKVVMFSDGSMEEAGKQGVRMAFGVVAQENQDAMHTVVTGRIAGFASSTKAELAGLFAAILASPRNTPTTIYIDNSAVVTQFKALVSGRQGSTERQRLRSTYAIWWSAVHNAYVHQGGKIKVEWIKGHAGHKGNEAADKAAKEAHFSDLWAINEKEHNDIQCHAMFKGAVVEGDLRQVLKRQST
ncbi:hypothetical protein BGZ54_004932, partial [Gamsiella multidivaricata]